MSTRYGHSNVGGGNQDQDERKDKGWESRQGGDQSRSPGSGEAEPREARRADGDRQPPPGTNTQGQLAGIGDASRAVEREGPETEPAERRSGTDQPPRMGGPLGPDRNDPHLPEGAQSNDEKGTGAGGFDRGVDATNVGAVHQGAREEDTPGGAA
jgi:hypothetical protein